MKPHKNKRHLLFVLIAIFFLCNENVPQGFAQRASGGKARSRTESRVNPPTQVEDSLASTLINKGQEFVENGNWDEAVKAYSQAASINPRSAEAYIGLGDAYMSLGKYKEGFVAYRHAVQVAPQNADAHYSLGAAYNDMAQYGEAFKPFVEAIRLDPNFAEAYYGIGFAYLWLDNYKDALGYLKQATGIKPDYPEAHFSLGLTYLGLNNDKGAKAELKILEGLDASLAKELERSIQAGAKSQITNAALEEQRRAQSSAGNRLSPDAPRQLEATETSASKPPPGNGKMQPGKIVRPTSASSEPVQPKRAAQNAANADSLLAVELNFWDSVKNSNVPEELAAYLKKYPDGQFSELARIRVRALEGRKDATVAVVEQKQETAQAQPKISQNQPNPAQEQATPAVETSKPVAEQPKDSHEPAKSVEEATKPSQEQPQPDGTATAAPKESGELNPAATLDETIDWIRKNFATKFAYKYATSGEVPNGQPTTNDVTVDYEPIKFEGCRIDWRDLSDVLTASLSELDPDSVKIEPRTRPNTTFSIEVWNLSINAADGKGAIREAKGDGSGTINVYSGLDLQLESRERAERLAKALKSAIKLCRSKSE